MRMLFYLDMERQSSTQTKHGAGRYVYLKLIKDLPFIQK